MTKKNILDDTSLLLNYLETYYTVSSFHNNIFSIEEVKDFYSYILRNGEKQASQGLIDFCNEADGERTSENDSSKKKDGKVVSINKSSNLTRPDHLNFIERLLDGE